MPPARTGVADYSFELLNALRRKGTVELSPRRADINLYHLGNNQLHADIYRQALKIPGVIVLHDAMLQHFALGFFSREEYIGEFVYNYGAWSESLAAELWAGRARSSSDGRYFRYPMLRRVVERSKAVIVHNPAAARIVREHVPEARVCEIPHLAWPVRPISEWDVSQLRKRLEIRPGETLCGVFGHLRESKRIRSAIEACRRAEVKLLIAGEATSDYLRSLEPSISSTFIHRIGYTTPVEFELLLKSVDLCINLKYPAAGETSGIAIRAMSLSRPVLITASEENARYPADAVVRVEPGLPEVSNLAAAIVLLRDHRQHARVLGSHAARYIRAEHHPDRVADLYWQVLSSA